MTKAILNEGILTLVFFECKVMMSEVSHEAGMLTELLAIITNLASILAPIQFVMVDIIQNIPEHIFILLLVHQLYVDCVVAVSLEHFTTEMAMELRAECFFTPV